jgi:hypothetical protein
MNRYLNTNLSPGQARFALLIDEKLPEFAQFWDFTARECLLGRVENYLSVCSHGEGIMLRFLVAVWLKSNRYDFDLVDAMLELDGLYLNVIKDWVSTPWWP